ncbi:hypothetical protein LCGC14_2993110 [marine sediment metagenome]|uniref:Uncharacterized protein n=1 Tax=marine sediment metagenome TaxID=412755 RepID=A0A0F8X3P8_9ZZZZ
MSVEDYMASIPARYWTNPVKTVHSSNNSGFINTVYLETITVVEIPCCVSLMVLVGAKHHSKDCEAVKAVQSWRGRWF